MIRRALASLAFVPMLLTAAPVHAQATGGCQFILGFKTLHALDPSDIGDCTDNQAFAANGDAQQHTTKGLMAWRKADNWTAFTNGYMTWINGPNGVASRLNTQRFSWEANPDGLPVVGPKAVTVNPPAPTQPSVWCCVDASQVALTLGEVPPGYTQQKDETGGVFYRSFVNGSDQEILISIHPSATTALAAGEFQNDVNDWMSAQSRAIGLGILGTLADQSATGGFEAQYWVIFQRANYFVDITENYPPDGQDGVIARSKVMASRLDTLIAAGPKPGDTPSRDQVIAQLRLQAQSADPTVRAAAAANTNTPSDVLAALTRDADIGVLAAVAGNSSVPVTALVSLLQGLPSSVWTCLDCNGLQVLLSASLNPSVPADVLSRLATHPNGDVRNHVAQNPSTPPEVLAALAKDSNPYVVQQAVAAQQRRGLMSS